MSFEEKSAWAFLLATVIAYAVYLKLVLEQAGGMPLTQVPYVWPLLWSIGGAIVLSILLHIVIATIDPRDGGKKDQRDRDIYRLGEYTGQSFVVIGGIAAMAMAMAQWDYFWIANVIYLCFVLSAILGSITKIALYRFGFHPW
ncbi:hypothetical protein [Devosia sp.]|uniref:hypothetical protein n=1 Tax=Devosia sp. TaxID=1871048 RepID=UPI003267E824